MWVSDDIDGLSTNTSEGDGSAEAAPPRRPRRRWPAVLLAAITLVAVVALLLWVPGAFASPSGGCGGG